MTVALPWVLVAAALAAGVVGLLHCIARRTTTPWLLPTARFLPAGDAPSTSVQRALTDRRLLLLRVLALGCLGLGAAGTRCPTGGATTWHVVVLDSSLAADSVRLLATLGGTARPVARAAIELVIAPLATVPGSAFTDALQAAARIARTQPSLQDVALHVRLPDSLQSMDGWRAWRAQWPATVDVQVTPRPSDRARPAPRGPSAGVATLRWPPRLGTADPLPGFTRRAVADTVGALVAGGEPIIAPWVRRWTAVRARSDSPRDGARPVAWWSDGEPAVLEYRTVAGCERSIGVEAPAGSDLLISEDAIGWRRMLAMPCGAVAGGARVASQSLVRDSTREGTLWPPVLPASWVRDSAAPSGAPAPWWLAPACFGAALVCLAGEAWWRRRSRG